ncbi:exodeoxyribonuclease V subunit beta [Alkalilimnicola ehrlichii]|uniref:exodeoxyribonuclease V subunit beta n=1 Tax=Alkalilimnicola ehrlichii TaxID=351052 RepID=UPI003BA20B87
MSQSAPRPLELLRLPLHGSRLIEASAGTGKTFTIAALYLRLVLGHGEQRAGGGPLVPPQILVVTFTEAATRELRDRIRERLSQAAAAFRDPARYPDDPVLPALRAEYDEHERPAMARRLELAAEWMDESAVSTIHSWCYRMLREHAFDSGSLFTQDLEADQTALLAEAVRDYWRSFLYPLAPEALVLARRALGDDPEALRQKVRPLIGQAAPVAPGLDSPEGFAGVLDDRLQALERLKRPWREQFEALEAQFHALRKAVLNGRKYQKPEALMAAMRAWAEDPAALQPEPVGSTSVLGRLCARGLAAGCRKGQTLPEDLHPGFTALDDYEHLCQLPEADLLNAAANWIGQRFHQAQRRRAQMGFDDLLTRLDQALTQGEAGERLAATLRRQFPVALIDEFQDTDPVQYRIFQRVYRVADNPREQALLLIGDPKQAIYSFRGADIHSYLQARRATAGRHYTLPRNFRSTGAMMRGVNRLFQHAEQAWPEGAFLFRVAEENPVPFLPVEAQGRAEALEVHGAAQPALTLWWEDEGEPVAGKHYLPRQAAACASHIVALLNAGAARQAGFRDPDGGLVSLRPRDMAVLVRDYNEARAIQQALARRRVRSVYLSDRESVYRTDEAGDLLRWLRACAEPTVERLLRAALATPTLGLPVAELHRLTADELLWERRVEQFRGYRRLWQGQGVLPMLRRLLHDFAVPARLVARADGERVLTNLLHLSELLQQAAAELDGEQALIRHLVEHRSGNGEGGDEQILRLESDEDLVKVVTVHKAKGLEYPLVFLPFICTFKPVDGKRLPYLDRTPGGAPRWLFEMDEETRARADRARLAEDLRLLYVAMTRARHACWLGLAPVKRGNRKSNQLHQTAVGYLLAGPEGVPDGGLEPALLRARGEESAIAVAPLPAASDEGYRGPEHRPALGPARVPRRPAYEHWWIASYSALSLHAEPAAGEAVGEPARASASTAPESVGQEIIRETVAEAGESAGPDSAALALHRFPRGPGPGTFLHGLLEWAADQGFAGLAEQPALLQREVARRCRRRGWSEWAGPVADWLLRLLQADYPLPEGGALRLTALPSYQPELEFLFQTRWLNAARLDRAVTAATLDAAPRPPARAALLNGMLKGFIDLVCEQDGRYYVADYKSNWLGQGLEDYAPEALRAAVLARRYDLQLVLYTLALHRLLRARLPGYDYERHVGGAVYLFLRGLDAPGRGLFHCRPPRALIEQLDDWLQQGPDRPDVQATGSDDA